MSSAASLALAAFLWLFSHDPDPDPWPRDTEVRFADRGRFPPSDVRRAEMGWWWARAERIKALAGEALAGPWSREWLRDYEEAVWMHEAWDELDWASIYSDTESGRESAVSWLRKYRARVGDENYAAGWTPPRVTGR